MSTLLLTVAEAFATGRSDVELHPRLIVAEAEATPFDVELRRPDGTVLAVRARFDLAHMRNAQGTFALLRLLAATPDAAPEGTEVWRLS